MNILPKNIKQGIFELKQIAREGVVAVYEKKSKYGSVNYEVILIQYLKEDKVMPSGKTKEAGEYYPSSSQWGRCGWTCLTKGRAFEKMDKLLGMG